MRKYSKLFRTEGPVQSSFENGRAFDCQLSKLSSFNFRPTIRQAAVQGLERLEEVDGGIMVRLMNDSGYEIGNLDATLILQRPKVSPHKEAIRDNLCKLLGADTSVVNLKAKTHEKVDSLGENRSIAAHTVVLLMKK